MYFAYLFAGVVVGYLSGSINSAIIITRLVQKTDIRELGNKNAGAANVGRNLGKGWAVFVFFFDVAKGVFPIILARLFLFDYDYTGFLALYAIGIAAIVGHCKPVYFRFKGGGGMATSLGVFLFFIPVEFFVSMMLGALIVALFIKNVKFRMTRWIPIVYSILTPFLTLALNRSIHVSLYGHISIGGHPWFILVGSFAVSLSILAVNLPFVLKKTGIAKRATDARD